MLLVGLTGGIGSGKTTVAELLRDRGAVTLDADEFARQALAPGSLGLAQVVDRFGSRVLAPDGSLDRDRLAGIVFADPAARRDLEAVVHPEVARRFAEAAELYRPTERTVVYVVPLLVERDLASAFDVVVVVSAPEDVRVARLALGRGMAEEDARARIRAQLPEEDRVAAADLVIDNGGSPEALAAEVDRLWQDLQRRREEDRGSPEAVR